MSSSFRFSFSRLSSPLPYTSVPPVTSSLSLFLYSFFVSILLLLLPWNLLFIQTNDSKVTIPAHFLSTITQEYQSKCWVTESNPIHPGMVREDGLELFIPSQLDTINHFFFLFPCQGFLPMWSHHTKNILSPPSFPAREWEKEREEET